MKEFTVCGVQIAPKPNDIAYNVEKIKEWAKKAKKLHNPELIVFPESATTGFTPNMPIYEFYNLLDPIPGKVTKEMEKLSKELDAYLVVPMYEKGEEPNVVYNSAVVIGPSEGIIGIYRKTHLFPTERLSAGGWSTPGKEAPVFELPFCKLGVMICYDGDFPELARELVVKGAEVIVRPSALLRSFDIWELTNRARAYDNHVYFVAVNAVGPDAGNNFYFGHSMIINPIAQKLAQARGTEEIIYAKLDPDPIKYVTYGASTPMIFDHVEDRNLEVYKNIMKKSKCPFEPAKRIPY
ncbi:carbon-nitrogen hydrolase family protein [Thermovenabulum sp.]|uniref:carbon-nitrogen hydrolase family protein n=1 Tax=Thermovenabulum sp. TaxID=3100335 RepID=UPI003C7A5BF7